ncbi:hypothetical protein PQR62_20255 [Herbaspirillum lusitanum]|uniref:Lipoprotein n=1 Tax=Herbaspirillum lusitanum TaxID=213312 RepID=A0ABW9ADP4_9BURK
MSKTKIGGLILFSLALSACSDAPKDAKLKDGVVRILERFQAPATLIENARKADVSDVNCKTEDRTARCDFKLGDKSYALNLVKAGDDIWVVSIPDKNPF